MEDAAEIARQRAEARRQKILARQKDRLTAITGVYSQEPGADEAAAEPRAHPLRSVEPSSAGGTPPAAPAAAAPAPAPPAPEPRAAQAAAAAADHEVLESMLATLQASIQQAAGGGLGGLGGGGGPFVGWGQPAGAPGGGPQWDPDAANAAMQTLLAGMPSDPLSSHPQAPSPSGLAGDAPGGAAAGTRQRQGGGGGGAGGGGGDLLLLLRSDAPAVLLWFGRVLGEVVGWTQQVRLLTAVLMAYAAVAGLLQPPAPRGARGGAWLEPRPALALCALQLALIAGAALLFGRAAARRVAERDAGGGGGGGGGGGAAAGGVRIPLRARELDILSFIPGAKEILSGLSGYRALFNALSEDLAVYLLTCGLLSLAAKS